MNTEIKNGQNLSQGALAQMGYVRVSTGVVEHNDVMRYSGGTTYTDNRDFVGKDVNRYCGVVYRKVTKPKPKPKRKKELPKIDRDLKAFVEFVKKESNYCWGSTNKALSWISSPEVQHALGFSDRYQRQLAARSAGVIFSSNYGYKHVAYVSQEDKDHCVGRLSSQCAKMSARIRELETAYANHNLKKAA